MLESTVYLDSNLLVDDAGCCFSTSSVSSSVHKNCLFLCSLHCPLLCDFCHNFMLLCHHRILSSSVSWSPPLSSLSFPLSSSSIQMLQFSLSKHWHVHLLSTLPQIDETLAHWTIVWKYSTWTYICKRAEVHPLNILSL